MHTDLTPLHRHPIPGTDESLPCIGIGSYQTFDVEASKTTMPKDILKAFIAAGGSVIDSSPMYGQAETAIGSALAELKPTPELFIATKVWTSGREAGVRQMSDSMRKLRRARVDLMQVHNLLDVEAHLDTLEEWREASKVRYIGITHYTASAHAAVAAVMRRRPLDFVQINYSLAEREAERVILPLALDRGIGVIVNRPFAGGTLLKALRGRELPADAVELQCATWAQLALKFIVSHPGVTCVIPATSDMTHLHDFLRAGRGRMPDAAARKRIEAATR